MQPVTGVPPGVPSGMAVPPAPPTLVSRFPSLASSLPGCLTGFGGPQGGKQLFEKFWKGTFKAVATPRAESVIMASITARRRVTSVEPPACPVAGGDKKEAEPSDSRVARDPDRRPSSPCKRRKHGSHRRARRGSFDGDLSPLPISKGKKKKRRSERKRRKRRHRSPSYSLSPQRKKKKKKKSSKKSKRHRYSSRKTKHSSSSLKRKRKDDRKHKKRSRGHSHRRRRHRRSESESSTWRSSSAESRHRQRESVRPSTPRGWADQRPEDMVVSLHQRGLEWGSAAKSDCKPAPNYPSILATGTIVPSNPGDGILNAKGVQHHKIPNSRKGPQDYDSGNDTSSPPATKTAGSRANGMGDKRPLRGGLASPEKLRFAEGDNVSDSGNSVTSYASLGKPLPANHGLATSVLSENIKSEQMSSRYGAEVVRPPQSAISPLRPPASPRGRRRAHSPSSRSSSQSRSSGRSRHSGRYSRSPTLSAQHRLYSRSPSYEGSLRRRGSVSSTSSRGSYFRPSPDRVQVRRGSPSPRGQDVKSGQGYKGKRRGGRSYSPMTKRRRDSPSHLEARRITSARKRPVPYFRPSPSSSGRSSSTSSWSSLFTRSRSRSPTHRLSRSRTRSRSYSSSSSYRSYSPSSSWNSIFGGRSRSPSRRL